MKKWWIIGCCLLGLLLWSVPSSTHEQALYSSCRQAMLQEHDPWIDYQQRLDEVGGEFTHQLALAPRLMTTTVVQGTSVRSSQGGLKTLFRLPNRSAIRWQRHEGVLFSFVCIHVSSLFFRGAHHLSVLRRRII